MVATTVHITEAQAEFVHATCLNLSKLVRKLLDKEIESETTIPNYESLRREFQVSKNAEGKIEVSFENNPKKDT